MYTVKDSCLSGTDFKGAPTYHNIVRNNANLKNFLERTPEEQLSSVYCTIVWLNLRIQRLQDQRKDDLITNEG